MAASLAENDASVLAFNTATKIHRSTISESGSGSSSGSGSIRGGVGNDSAARQRQLQQQQQHSQSAAARGLQNVRMSWGTIQEASTVVDALSLFPQSVLQEVGVGVLAREAVVVGGVIY
jgi:hypothetical protein